MPCVRWNFAYNVVGGFPFTIEWDMVHDAGSDDFGSAFSFT
ncbi:hypothetical protein EGYY_07170 [Eggerthella sp. YY7918]|nr:hypothetical protein EGYY_07170 [Eggerthella sp. YY7918]